MLFKGCISDFHSRLYAHDAFGESEKVRGPDTLCQRAYAYELHLNSSTFQLDKEIIVTDEHLCLKKTKASTSKRMVQQQAAGGQVADSEPNVFVNYVIGK